MQREKGKNLLKENPKVSKLWLVADEAIVAKIPERVGVMPLQAKGFT
jgi:hypothetical protein